MRRLRLEARTRRLPNVARRAHAPDSAHPTPAQTTGSRQTDTSSADLLLELGPGADLWPHQTLRFGMAVCFCSFGINLGTLGAALHRHATDSVDMASLFWGKNISLYRK